jgi:hypothetical protein
MRFDELRTCAPRCRQALRIGADTGAVRSEMASLRSELPRQMASLHSEVLALIRQVTLIGRRLRVGLLGVLGAIARRAALAVD